MKKLLFACLVSLSASHALAYEQGQLIVKVGAATVQPDGDGALDGALDVSDNTQVGLSLTYMMSSNLGLSLLAATPFSHDIELNGETVAETKHLPPTITMQYHFLTSSVARPYVGAGINYTVFFDEDGKDLGDLSLDSSVGLALQAGMDFKLSEKVGISADLWYADIETDAKLNGNKLDTVKIDPWVFMVSASFTL